jgi:hypothetical protein
VDAADLAPAAEPGKFAAADEPFDQGGLHPGEPKGARTNLHEFVNNPQMQLDICRRTTETDGFFYDLTPLTV